MNEQNNVKEPLHFSAKLKDIMKGMYDFFESIFEEEYPEKTQGVTHFVGTKCCFQVAAQYQRPHDFLQSLLDILRVMYEPAPLGTFLLNSNPSFLYDAFPETSFQLGYGSFVSKPHQIFKEFWSDSICKSLKEYGYDQKNADALFVVISTGKERYGLDLMDEVCGAIHVGFSCEDAVGLIKSMIHDDFPEPVTEVHAGYCLVPELKEKLRVSLWMFITHED